MQQVASHLTSSIHQIVLMLCIVFMIQPLSANDPILGAQTATVHFSLDNCESIIPGETPRDYSEFTAEIDSAAFVDLGVVGGHLYRTDSYVNIHSCAPGVDGTPAMCVSARRTCDYQPLTNKSVRFDISVNPREGDTVVVNKLSFWELAPEEFTFLDGVSGPNAYPTLYGVRVLRDDVEVYRQTAIPTSQEWSLEEIDFTGVDAFIVSESAVFSFQLLGYCSFQNFEDVQIWDLDEISIEVSSFVEVDGGELFGGPFEFCVGDGFKDSIRADQITLRNTIGANQQWVITDADSVILGLPADITEVDFDGAEFGNCLIWNVSYEGEMSGLEAGFHIDDIEGCLDFSNPLSVIRVTDGMICDIAVPLSGGNLSISDSDRTTIAICAGDGFADPISLEVNNESGVFSRLVITDADGEILALPDTNVVDLEGAGDGQCLIYNIVYNTDRDDLIVGADINELGGVYALSNAITVNRTGVVGGSLTGGPFDFCIDGEADFVNGVDVTGVMGMDMQWVITDQVGIILGLPDSIEAVDFDAAGTGTCLIWYLSYSGEISGLADSANVADLAGCFAFSDSIVVNRSGISGGTLSGGPYDVCVDGEPDFITDIVVLGVEGFETQWIVTDEAGNILGLPDSIEQVDFDAAGTGSCLIYYLSYIDDIAGLSDSTSLDDIVGCFGLSNPLAVTRTSAEGGTLSGGPYDICVDGQPDFITDIVLTDATGANMQWIITDTLGNVIGLPDSIHQVDFDAAGAGICLIYHLSYSDGIEGLSDSTNVNKLSGCYDLSNPITVNREGVDGGVLTGGDFIFCVDSIADFAIGVELSDALGANSQWVITDTSGNILGLPDSVEQVDFNDAGAGICQIWHLSYADGLTGLTDSTNVSDLAGCYDFSNALIVTRVDSGAVCGDTMVVTPLVGGSLTIAGDTIVTVDICAGDGVADSIDVDLVEASGDSSAWVITDTSGLILGVPLMPPFDLEGAGAGVCQIWHISYNGALTGLTVDSTVSGISGDFVLSNPITVNREGVDGGVLTGGDFTFCVDSIADFAIGVELSDAIGANSQWVITDTSGNILGLPDSVEQVDFNDAGAGICQIWHLSYADGLTGLTDSANVSDLAGCYDFSNALIVTRVDSGAVCGDTMMVTPLVGGSLTIAGDTLVTVDICAGDGSDDLIDVAITGNSGDSTAWVITDTSGLILDVPMAPPFNLEGAGPGVCQIWHISYNGALTGLTVDSTVSGISGDFVLSNPITVNREGVDGGVLTGGDFTFCVDSIADFALGVELSDALGANSQWVITDTSGNILGLPDSVEEVDFNDAGAGTCQIWHLSYADGLTGLTDSTNVSDLAGCYDFSNALIVTRVNSGAVCGDTMVVTPLVGGSLTIAGDTIVTVDICAGDGVSDSIDVDLVGASGDNSGWVITDTSGLILGVPQMPPFDLEGAGAGVCQIWHISYNGALTGLTVDSTVSSITGDFVLSNPITVNREGVDGGVLTGGEFTFCIDSIADFALGVELSDAIGANSQWVITDTSGNILGLPDSVEQVDFNDAGAGICQIWHLSYADGLTGLTDSTNVSDLAGCYDFSNALIVTRVDSGAVCGDTMVVTPLVGGSLRIAGDTLEMVDICVGDGVADSIDVDLVGASGDSSAWVITDTSGLILGVPAMPPFDLEGAGAGVCQIWHISYNGALTGLTVDSTVRSISGNFVLSNPITVNREGVDGGVLTGGDFTFCVDSIADFALGVELSDALGANSQWVITDTSGNILGLPDSVEQVDFNDAGAGICQIWHLSYADGLTGLTDSTNVSDLAGCYDFSNALIVTRVDSGAICGDTMMVTPLVGGSLTIAGDTLVTVDICAGDGVADSIDVDLVGASGDSSAWVITDTSGLILGVPVMPPFDLEGAGAGICQIWHISYNGALIGLTTDSIVSGISGNFVLSNPITVNREGVDGGVLTGGDFTFCVDSIADFALGVEVSDALGANSQWVITDTSGNILGLPDSVEQVDFNDAGAGICQIWHLSYADGLTGLTDSTNVSDLAGCYDFSNALIVTRVDSGSVCGDTMVVTPLVGGSLTIAGDTLVTVDICAGDGADDLIDVAITGNSGDTTAWVITDTSGLILDVPMAPPFNLEGAGPGICQIWHISYNGALIGLIDSNTIDQVTGDFVLSNPVTVVRTGVDGGVLSGGPFIVCSDGDFDFISEVQLSDAVGAFSQFIIADVQGQIIALPENLSSFDFDPLPSGAYFIWHLSYADTSTVVNLGMNILNIGGCSDRSNAVTVNVNQPRGGTLSGGPYGFCFDGVADRVSGLTISDADGQNMSWVITDESDTIVGLPIEIDSFDFEDLDLGTYRIYNVSYITGLDGLNINSDLNDLDGCYALSDSVEVDLGIVNVGVITGGSSYTFCTDGVSDFIDDLRVVGNTGANLSWFISNSQGAQIIGVADTLETFDFEQLSTGIYILRAIAYADGLTGLEAGGLANQISGCFDISSEFVQVRVVDTGENCVMGDPLLVLNEVTGTGLVEIKNIGTGSINIGDHYLCQAPTYELIDSLEIECGDLDLAPGELVTLRLDDIMISGMDGEMALYRSDSFTDPSAIVSYVEWGSAGHTRSSVAVSAGLWIADDIAETFGTDMSLSYDGSGVGADNWDEILPSPCDENNVAGSVFTWSAIGNPFSESFKLQIESVTDYNIATIDILSVQGHQVGTLQVDLAKGTNVVDVDMSEHDDGLYLLKLRVNSDLRVLKIVKQN